VTRRATPWPVTLRVDDATVGSAHLTLHKETAVPRYDWHQLPAGLRSAVEERTGRIMAAESVQVDGVSDLAAILHTDDGEIFCKGACGGTGARQNRREAHLNPYLRAFAPRLRWHIEQDDWVLLGFDRASGRHADLAPDSPDLPLLATTLAAMSCAPPVPAAAPNAPAGAFWGTWVSPKLISGDTQLHTDVAPSNFLIDGATVTVVDWAKSCYGAPWIDTTLLAIRLVRAGHTPARAEEWAGLVPAWRDAPPGAVTAFVKGMAKCYHQLAQPARPANLVELSAAAAQWSGYRETRSDNLVEVVWKW
jgi:hypothetical protein